MLWLHVAGRHFDIKVRYGGDFLYLKIVLAQNGPFQVLTAQQHKYVCVMKVHAKKGNAC